MADVRVNCINKKPREDSHYGITHLGGPGSKKRWRWTRQEVIDSIKAKTNTFYTLEDGTRANIGIYEGANGDYLKTHADGKWNDNLLALKECPDSAA